MGSSGKWWLRSVAQLAHDITNYVWTAAVLLGLFFPSVGHSQKAQSNIFLKNSFHLFKGLNVMDLIWSAQWSITFYQALAGPTQSTASASKASTLEDTLLDHSQKPSASLRQLWWTLWPSRSWCFLTVLCWLVTHSSSSWRIHSTSRTSSGEFPFYHTLTLTCK